MKKVSGTIIRHSNYHANIRIPQEIAKYWDNQEFYRKSLKTSDPREAERQVRAIRTLMDSHLQKETTNASMQSLIDNLSADQRAILEHAGGIEGLLTEHQKGRLAHSFVLAGISSGPEEFDVEENGNGPSKIHLGDVDDSDRRIAAVEAGSIQGAASVVKAQTNRSGRVLRALGHDAELIDDVVCLQDVASKWRVTVDAQTASDVDRALRRFVDVHGEVDLHELKRSHLRDFLDEIAGLPKISSKKLGDNFYVRDLSVAEGKKWARDHSVATLSSVTIEKTKNQMVALMNFAVSQGYLKTNVWDNYKIPKPKVKFDDEDEKTRPFTQDELRQVFECIVSSKAKKYSHRSIDRWAPFFSAYLGPRIQEICQLRFQDFFYESGLLCIHITDAGKDMKAKNVRSVRRIPVHPELIAQGFEELFVSENEKSPEGEMFFQKYDWQKKHFTEMTKDNWGRTSNSYSKRFSEFLRSLGIKDEYDASAETKEPRVSFHSLRHNFQDAADSAGIPDAHRRAIAGRSSGNRVEDSYGQGPSMAALYESLQQIKLT